MVRSRASTCGGGGTASVRSKRKAVYYTVEVKNLTGGDIDNLETKWVLVQGDHVIKGQRSDLLGLGKSIEFDTDATHCREDVGYLVEVFSDGELITTEANPPNLKKTLQLRSGLEKSRQKRRRLF